MTDEKMQRRIVTQLLLWDILTDVLDFLIFGAITVLLFGPIEEVAKLTLILWQFRFVVQLLLGVGMLITLVAVIRRIRTIIIIRREISPDNQG